MPPARFERTTPGLGIRCSILLSYGGAAPKMAQSRHGNKGGRGATNRLPGVVVAPGFLYISITA